MLLNEKNVPLSTNFDGSSLWTSDYDRPLHQYRPLPFPSDALLVHAMNFVPLAESLGAFAQVTNLILSSSKQRRIVLYECA